MDYSNIDLDAIWRGMRKRARKTQNFRRMTERRYRDPRGYPAFEAVAERITAQTIWDAEAMQEADFAQRKASGIATAITQAPPPVWWLAADFGNALLRSECPSIELAIPSDGRIKRPMGVIILPTGFLSTTDGDPLLALCWHALGAGESFDCRMGSGALLEIANPVADKPMLNTLAISARGTLYAQGMCAGDEDRRLSNFHISDYYQNPDMDAEALLTASLRSLAIQAILAIDHIDGAISSESKGRGMAKGAASTKTLSEPRYLGRQYKRSDSPRQHHGGTHASPTTHWRAGHWRNQPYGPGRAERRPTWIQPTIVGE